MTQITTALEFAEPKNRTQSSAVNREQLESDDVSHARDDFSREVYGVLGIPVDAVEMADVVRKIEAAAAAGTPFLLSTPNLNFLIGCQSDVDFRESLLRSDLCTPDGMPVVWIARLMGLPIRRRVAGSDIFEALKRGCTHPLKLFLFGGEAGVAERACHVLNSQSSGLHCVGFHDPGFCPVEEMSTQAIIDAINASGADFLSVSLGALKGQKWLLRNYDRLRVPVRSHLGATVNFQAGTVSRSPLVMQRLGLEWLWRIKEEPHLWRRYAADGYGLVKLVVTRVAPAAALAGWMRLTGSHSQTFSISQVETPETLTLMLHGSATRPFVRTAASHFRQCGTANRRIVIDFSQTRRIDARFIGCLLMLRKQLNRRSQSLEFVGMPPLVGGIFRLNGFGYLLTGQA